MTTPTCRFCYSYKPQGPIETVCKPVVSATIQTISCNTGIINNNFQTSDQSLLKSRQACFLRDTRSMAVSSTIQSTINNAAAINNDLYNQLLQLRNQRYSPYQPYVPPVMPSSVTDLQRMTANVGNPMAPFTIMNCKGSQFVTK
jgi:hypothetical protein